MAAAMAVDNRQQQSQLAGLSYDPLRAAYTVPHFTNPWAAGSAAPHTSQQMYTSPNQTTSAGMDSLSQAAAQRPTTISMPYSGLPVTASGMSTADLMNSSRSYVSHQQQQQQQQPQYSTAGSAAYLPATTSNYPMEYSKYASSAYDRRSSHPLNAQQRSSFSDAVEASRGMLAMSADITPRNIYGDGHSSRHSSNSYGFPSTHSGASSISSASSAYPSYYAGSVAGDSVSDYSSASESVDLNSRTLPRPSTLMGGSVLNPPAPQSMMGQFSSKVSSSSQKKHKCKVCDKRFTRPSSLQTHMYSHTGEKPFACEVEGCGRHFSVVSNLRRHRKVHKNDGSTAGSVRDHASPDDL